MRITMLLALTATTVVGTACNGISPTSPDAAGLSEAPIAVVDVKASGGTDRLDPCRSITEVQLILLERSKRTVLATYLFQGQEVACQVSPRWSSTPESRLVPTKDPFIVKVTQTRPLGPVKVTARAPNGIEGTIRVDGR